MEGNISINTVDEANAELNRIVSFVRSSHDKIKKGEDVDLTGLDTRIQYFCETILAFPQEEALTYEEPLQNLSSDLVALQSALEDAQGDVGQELNELNAHQNAAKAYTKKDSDN